MALRYCFELNGIRICNDIPILVDIFKLPPDDDGPRPDEKRFLMVSENWIVNENLNSSVVKSLPVYAAIERLAQELDIESREPIMSVLRDSVKRLDLPSDISIDF